MSTDFYDQYAIKAITGELRLPTPKERNIKKHAHSILKQKGIDMYPEGSNQAEMAKWNKVAPIPKTSFELLTEPKDHINPSHYKGIVGDYQYIECMEFILGTDGLRAHLIGQGYKYLMRLGKKDDADQELNKAIWYFRCLSILLRDGTIIGKLDELK